MHPSQRFLERVEGAERAAGEEEAVGEEQALLDAVELRTPICPFLAFEYELRPILSRR